MKVLQRSLRSGFSLIEIIIAVAIMAIVAGVAVVNLTGVLDKQRISSTKSDLKGFKQSIDIFYADTGSYPTELNDLAEKPSDERIGAKWAGPYMDKIKVDNWNNDFQYERTAQGEHPYELYSFGPKGEDAPEEERLTVWE